MPFCCTAYRQGFPRPQGIRPLQRIHITTAFHITLHYSPSTHPPLPHFSPCQLLHPRWASTQAGLPPRTCGRPLLLEALATFRTRGRRPRRAAVGGPVELMDLRRVSWDETFFYLAYLFLHWKSLHCFQPDRRLACKQRVRRLAADGLETTGSSFPSRCSHRFLVLPHVQQASAIGLRPRIGCGPSTLD